ncbi:MAG: CPBP family glutamic-type intramembrane protease [Ktedonobacteraceae bacterium]
MSIPALVAVFLRLIYHEGFSDAGLRLIPLHKPFLNYFLAYVVFIVLVTCGLALDFLTGFLHWNPVDYHSLIVSTLINLSIYPLVASITAFGEELGWRGYLLMRLLPEGSGWAAIITGIIWGLWHIPLTLQYTLQGINQSWIGVPLNLLLFVPAGVIIAWLRLRSGSIYVASLAHAMLNSIVIIIPLLLSTKSLPLLIPPYWWYIILLPTSLCAVLLLFTSSTFKAHRRYFLQQLRTGSE